MERPSTLLNILIAAALALALAGCAAASTPAPTAAPTAPPTTAPIAPTATEAAAAPTANLTDGCVQDYTPGVDYFPDKTTLTYAQNFTVEYHNNYKVVTTLTPWPGADRTFQAVLVQCGTPTPTGFEGATVIQVPVQHMVAMSTSYITMLDDLGQLDRLAGVDSFAYVNNPTVRQMIDAGKVVEIAPAGTVNVETALNLAPDLVMAYSSGTPEYDTFPALIDAGLPVVMNADWTEATPLARAEWVKFIALFFNAEAKADTVFSGIAQRYEDAAALAASVGERPTTFTDTPYEGTWYVAGGQSFTARLIHDAGADYVFADNTDTGSPAFDFETVFNQAQNADFWVNVWTYTSLDEMRNADERFAQFTAFQDGQVYAVNTRETQYGNDYFETGAAHPQIVLLDLIKIFHPELVPDHELYYYQQLK